MALINHIIPPAAYERVRDQIGLILATELNTQAYISGDEEADVYVERWVPVDKTEPPVVIVMLSTGTYANQHQGQADGTYTYLIDCYERGVSSDSDDADAMAIVALHKLLRQVRYILEDPQYKTLGFAPPFVMHRRVTNLAIAKPDPQDGASLVMGRITLEVRVPETNQLLEPKLLAGIDTTFKLSETELGYLFIYNAPTL